MGGPVVDILMYHSISDRGGGDVDPARDLCCPDGRDCRGWGARHHA